MFFFFNDTATTEIYTLSLHDALPISLEKYLEKEKGACSSLSNEPESPSGSKDAVAMGKRVRRHLLIDRKSTRLNSSHLVISYAVFCLKKKKMRTFSFTLLEESIIGTY